MVSVDSAFVSILCVSTFFLILVLEQGAEGALDPSPPHKAHPIKQNPFYSSVPEGNYQDFYEIPSQFESAWKRVPSSGFYGMRGKKAASTSFYGMRGKKGPVGFLGMRGKKMDGGQLVPVTSEHDWDPKEFPLAGLPSDEEKVELTLQSVDSEPPWKRAPSQGFMGLRGKRALKNQNVAGNLW